MEASQLLWIGPWWRGVVVDAALLGAPFRKGMEVWWRDASCGMVCFAQDPQAIRVLTAKQVTAVVQTVGGAPDTKAIQQQYYITRDLLLLTARDGEPVSIANEVIPPHGIPLFRRGAKICVGDALSFHTGQDWFVDWFFSPTGQLRVVWNRRVLYRALERKDTQFIDRTFTVAAKTAADALGRAVDHYRPIPPIAYQPLARQFSPIAAHRAARLHSGLKPGYYPRYLTRWATHTGMFN